ncbi:PD-(D/E)XK nuclease-like domain-containing protein [Bdellovibrio sp. HCB288]|uniref:PD-(D/E)XK nuclease-like domain-containing protein n=1 Tax=Bdellovibrio sp. HCB288 TaxID=3394355 RepID=UPI0039B49C35
MKLGIFENMPAEEYHALDAIGSSSLINMLISPAHFHAAWKGPKEEPTSAMIRGNLIHSLLLEQDIGGFVARPLDAKGNLVRSNSAEYKAFLEANPGKKPVDPEDFDNMYEMLTAFAKNTRAMAMLDHARIETSIVALCPITGLHVKARPDAWGHGYLDDLKSTSQMARFENQLFQMSYDVRLAHYAYVIELATGEKVDDFFFTPFETSRPFGSRVFQLSASDVKDAKRRHLTILNEIAVCLKDNSWPCYSDEIITATKPRWMIEEEITFDGVG